MTLGDMIVAYSKRTLDEKNVDFDELTEDLLAHRLLEPSSPRDNDYQVTYQGWLWLTRLIASVIGEGDQDHLIAWIVGPTDEDVNGCDCPFCHTARKA